MVNSKDTRTIREFIQKNGMQITLQAVGLVVLILNLWLTSKLAPLAEGLRELGVRVFALESSREVDNADTKILLERFYKAEQKIENIDRTTQRIESKLDSHNM